MINKQTRYRIKISGHLDSGWQSWFDGLAVTTTADGNTELSGVIADQAALYGVLKKIRNLGLILISVIPQNDTASGDDETGDKQVIQDQSRPSRVDHNR